MSDSPGDSGFSEGRWDLQGAMALAACVLAIALAMVVWWTAPALAARRAASATVTQLPSDIVTHEASPSPSAVVTVTARPGGTITTEATVTPPTTVLLTTTVVAMPVVTTPLTSTLGGTGILSGTIIANRTAFTVTFFLSGRTYRLRGFRSLGTRLPRTASVLELYNCEVGQESVASQRTCFWDPYLVQRDGFYEIVNGAAEGKPVRLVLRSAAPPPAGQVWIHNRTGHQETIIYGDSLRSISAGAVEEISTGDQQVTIFHLRHCLTLAGKTVCEWLPWAITRGGYYALVEKVKPVTLPGGRVTTMKLERILPPSRAGLVATSVTPVASPAVTSTPTPTPLSSFTCKLQVPALNVRAGPGLRYLVIGAVRVSQELGTVSVRGRDASGAWLAVDERIAPGGWISGDAAFIRCDGDVMELPIVDVTDGRLAPTPSPVPAGNRPQPTPTPLKPSPGKALLVVHNAFSRDITFTLSPKVWTLKPGKRIVIEVPPGRVTFSASTPFHSGNAEVRLTAGERRDLWLRFAPKTPGSKVYVLEY
ncbi:MAG: hypothetical protein J7M34_10545 [Anaerolineae bacterium]|nr:hypothetical protein [Anaerolineae bacterium]